jgi:hypothetical protein|nr:MAG TPA: hypothetical protein [Caudoviricetes sp.]
MVSELEIKNNHDRQCKNLVDPPAAGSNVQTHVQNKISECAKNILYFSRDKKMHRFWSNAFSGFSNKKRKADKDEMQSRINDAIAKNKQIAKDGEKWQSQS